MNKRLSIIFMLMSLVFLGSLKAQELEKPSIAPSLKYQGSIETTIGLPNFLSF